MGIQDSSSNSGKQWGASLVRVNIEINDDVHKKARLSSLLRNITLKEYIWKAIEEKLRDRDKKHGKKG